MPFQLNSKNICLTYPRCDVSANDALAQLCSVFADYAVYICVCTETHSDGGFHLHAAVACSKPFRTRDCRFADLRSGDGNNTFHASIEPSRRFSAWLGYVKKDGRFIEWGTEPFNKAKVDVSEDELCHAAKTLDFPEFLAYCSVNKLMYAKALWDAYHTDAQITLSADHDFAGIIDPRFERLMGQCDLKPELTLLLVGKSGIGKTTWAKRHIPKPCLFVTHLDDLKKFKVDFHVSILFDDVSLCHLPETSQIHLVDFDNPRSIHIRHTIARVPAGIRKIITCNTIPVTLDNPAIQRRTQLLQCNEIDLLRCMQITSPNPQ